MTTKLRRVWILGAVTLLGAALAARAGIDTQSPLSDTASLAGSVLCDSLDPAHCLFPFPSDHLTVPADTPTGRRIAFPIAGMPQNAAGKPIDPTEWNRNDGFSPGSAILTFVPGIDLENTWGSSADHVTDLGRYTAPEAPIVILNTRTGERHPFWSELDTHPATDPSEAVLILRPAVNFEEGTRYVVALRNLIDAAGNAIEPGPVFASYRDDGPGPATDPLFDARRPAMERIFADLASAGIDRNDLYLAWDFTVASAQSIAGRALHIRDDAFRKLGDFDLADLVPSGNAPAFVIDSVEEIASGRHIRKVRGRITVPNYLRTPQDEIATVENPVDDLPVIVPGSRFYYPPGSDLPGQNPALPTLQAGFVCSIPRTATTSNPARPSVYGHGLLGSRTESEGSSTSKMTELHNVMYCAVDWAGMSFADFPNVLTILADVSNFPTLADRAQQGFLNFLFLGRALVHPDGFASRSEFRDGGSPLFDRTKLVYDGNSQGGIMGGALAALAVDYTRAVLGVPGMNYSTLLNRSVDWEGNFADTGDAGIDAPTGENPGVGYSTVLYRMYPEKREQQLVMALIQMLWDRAEANGFAHHMTNRPYPNTPPHQVLLHVALGDYQVANVSAEVEARTIGARTIQHALDAGRHWATDPFFGLPDVTAAGPFESGSAIVYWDSGNPLPPNGNVPPMDFDEDPHSDPRKDTHASCQKAVFYDTGTFLDVFPGEPYRTFEFPRHPDLFPGEEAPAPRTSCP